MLSSINNSLDNKEHWKKCEEGEREKKTLFLHHIDTTWQENFGFVHIQETG